MLECWDRAIKNLELKIEKKRQIKKGLQQRLLSGKLRLTGEKNSECRIGNSELKIPAGWKSVRLGDVFDFIKTYAFSRSELTTENIQNSGIYNIHYGDIHSTYIGACLNFCRERCVPMLTVSDNLPANIVFLKDGDLVMADASEDYAGVGTCIELKNVQDKKVTGGLHTFVLRDKTKQTCVGYRGYMFKEYSLAKELKRIATGVSVYSISKTNLAKVELQIPPLPEQKAIARVLAAADSEIEAL